VITFVVIYFHAFPSINQSFDLKVIEKTLRDFGMK